MNQATTEIATQGLLQGNWKTDDISQVIEDINTVQSQLRFNQVERVLDDIFKDLVKPKWMTDKS